MQTIHYQFNTMSRFPCAGRTRQISVANRVDAIHDYTSSFREHLIQSPGAVLTATLRLAVVHCAREAPSCESCAHQLPHEVCLRPGTKRYDVIEKIKHSCPKLSGNVPESVKKVLVAIVHSIVNHQGRLDRGWYESVIEIIFKTEGILPVKEKDDEYQRQYLAYVAFSEILLLTAMVHCMNMAYLVMGRKLPPLPTLDEMKAEPMLVDWAALLKREPRQNASVSFARYNYPGDYNQRSLEFRSISKEAWKSMKGMMDRMDPCLPTAYATEDTVFMKQLGEVYYVPQKVS